ncbi:MAG: Spi family protease inhibitor, partial [Muribaculaceae bacterium]|nr:Spi family protease inhibitor [Muribaculaceae bacterium]
MNMLKHLPSWLRMSRYLLAVSLVLSAFLPAMAVPVTPDEALERAMKFTSSGAEGIFKSAARKPLTQADIVYVGKRGETDCFYVINTDGGFVIVSADTRLNEVLGYSDRG